MKHQNKITLKEHQLWDFCYKEICKVCEVSKVDLALSKEYKGFRRRFEYFLKKLKASHNIKS